MENSVCLIIYHLEVSNPNFHHSQHVECLFFVFLKQRFSVFFGGLKITDICLPLSPEVCATNTQAYGVS